MTNDDVLKAIGFTKENLDPDGQGEEGYGMYWDKKRKHWVDGYDWQMLQEKAREEGDDWEEVEERYSYWLQLNEKLQQNVIDELLFTPSPKEELPENFSDLPDEEQTRILNERHHKRKWKLCVEMFESGDGFLYTIADSSKGVPIEELPSPKDLR